MSVRKFEDCAHASRHQSSTNSAHHSQKGLVQMVGSQIVCQVTASVAVWRCVLEFPCKFLGSLDIYDLIKTRTIAAYTKWRMDASVTEYILTLHAEVDTRGWYPTLVGSDAAVPASIVCSYTLDLQREVGSEPRMRTQSNIHTTTLPSQVKTYSAGHHTGQQCIGAWRRCYIERYSDVRWRLYTQTNTQIHKVSVNFSTWRGFPRPSHKVYVFTAVQHVCLQTCEKVQAVLQSIRKKESD